MNEEEANTDLRELEMETRRDADPRHRGKGFDGWTSNIFRADVEGLDTPSCPKPSDINMSLCFSDQNVSELKMTETIK